MVAGLAGLAVFLVLHHLGIVPIWFIAPIGTVMAGAGGAAVGAAYAAGKRRRGTLPPAGLPASSTSGEPTGEPVIGADQGAMERS